jgi:hypothetical protein
MWNNQTFTREEFYNAFQPIKVYSEESHFERGLLVCSEFGQNYFYKFYEEIDWDEGEDGLYMTWITIEDIECADELYLLSPLDLASFRVFVLIHH